MTDAETFRLRTFIDSLGDDEVHRVAENTDLVDIARIVDGTSKAVMFESVGREHSKLAANVAGSRARLAKAFDVPQEGLLPRVLQRLSAPGTVIEVERSDAP